MRSGSRIGGRDELGERRVAVNKLLWWTDVGELPHYSLAWSHAHTHAPTHACCNTQSGEGKAKQPFGVNSWDGQMVVAGFTQKGRTGRKPYQLLKQVNTAACESFILRCGSAGMPVSSDSRMSQRSGPHSLIYLRPVQDRALYLTVKQT